MREVISKLQTMRKDAGFDVTDRIDVRVETGETLASAIASSKDWIMKATLTVSLDDTPADDSFTRTEWDINGEKAAFAVRVHKA